MSSPVAPRWRILSHEDDIDRGDGRAAKLNDCIKRIFRGNYFEMIPFAGGPWEVPDDTGDGRPRLVVMSYDGVWAGTAVESVPG